MLTKNKPKLPTFQTYPKWLNLFILIVIILGIYFRFVNLDRKVYWHDEAYTSLRISGYTKAELVQEIFTGQVINVESLQKYQRPSQRNFTDTVNSLKVEEAQHPPLYYVMVRFWTHFAHSVAATRSLSAIISLSAFGCIYWLCVELFQSPLTGWISIALLAVSPIHVLYAQEARQFSLWTVIILLESATLLAAIRSNKLRLWIYYTITVVLGLYTFLFSALVAIAHGCYVLATQNRFTKIFKAYLLSTTAAFLYFVPWILAIINNATQIDNATTSAQKRQTISALLSGWISNISYLFGDFWRYEPFYPDLNLPILRWGKYLVPLLLILVIYTLYYIYRHSQEKVWLFIYTLVGVPGVTLILSDLILGGKLSTRARYIIPCYLGVQLAIAYLLARQIISLKPVQRKFWQIITVLLISTGIISCAVSSQAVTWWNKGSHANPEIARIINNTTAPLLISSTYSLNVGDLMSLSHRLDNKVKLQLVAEPNLPKIPDNFSDIFLYNPSNQFKSELEKTVKLTLVYKPGRLWRIKKS
jgi:uncharacterized membrane protein